MSTDSQPFAIAPYDFDDELQETALREQRPQTRVYSLDHAVVVLGRGSKAEIELHVENVAADGVPVYRRAGGGCAVVIDPGNLIVSVALPLPGIGDTHKQFRRLTGEMISALNSAGVAGVSFDGVSDLVIGDRKISGSCVYRRKGLLYYSATLLMNPDFALFDRYLRHPPREPSYRRGRSHAMFLTAVVRETAGGWCKTQLRTELARVR